ncbi:hypothetical protein [Nocardia nova]|uniref:hypothetical protein n=1 Tax=Nocardia nova TaxID=37330 RepID=UPI0033C1B6E5
MTATNWIFAGDDDYSYTDYMYIAYQERRVTEQEALAQDWAASPHSETNVRRSLLIKAVAGDHLTVRSATDDSRASGS